VIATLVCLVAGSAAGAAERLQDLAPEVEARVDLQWAPVDRSRTARADPRFHQMTAELSRVEYRLYVAPWLGKRMRVVLVVPQPPGLMSSQGLLLRWRTQGPLRAGQGRGGDRIPVFEGVLTEPVLADVLSLSLQVDGRQFDGLLQMSLHFEIEAL